MPAEFWLVAAIGGAVLCIFLVVAVLLLYTITTNQVDMIELLRSIREAINERRTHSRM